MFVTADQLVAHAVGDYLLQSDWMAQGKRRRWWPASVHVFLYGLCFLPFQPSFWALWLIVTSHLMIDRFGLARYVVWAKNWIGPGNLPWKACHETGYPPGRPAWMAVWLTIIADNVFHVLINAAALRWF
jgi:hypothetical protein